MRTTYHCLLPNLPCRNWFVFCQKWLICETDLGFSPFTFPPFLFGLPYLGMMMSWGDFPLNQSEPWKVFLVHCFMPRCAENSFSAQQIILFFAEEGKKTNLGSLDSQENMVPAGRPQPRLDDQNAENIWASFTFWLRSCLCPILSTPTHPFPNCFQPIYFEWRVSCCEHFFHTVHTGTQLIFSHWEIAVFHIGTQKTDQCRCGKTAQTNTSIVDISNCLYFLLRYCHAKGLKLEGEAWIFQNVFFRPLTLTGCKTSTSGSRTKCWSQRLLVRLQLHCGSSGFDFFSVLENQTSIHVCPFWSCAVHTKMKSIPAKFLSNSNVSFVSSLQGR